MFLELYGRVITEHMLTTNSINGNDRHYSNDQVSKYTIIYGIRVSTRNTVLLSPVLYLKMNTYAKNTGHYTINKLKSTYIHLMTGNKYEMLSRRVFYSVDSLKEIV